MLLEEKRMKLDKFRLSFDTLRHVLCYNSMIISLFSVEDYASAWNAFPCCRMSMLPIANVDRRLFDRMR